MAEGSAPRIELMLLNVGALSSIAALAFATSYLLTRARRAAAAFTVCVLALTATWWCISISFVLMNKLLLGVLGKLVGFPVTMTACHMLIKGVLASMCLLCTRSVGAGDAALRNRLDNGVDHSARSMGRATRWCTACCRMYVRIVEEQQLNRSSVCQFVVPLGASTALDVCMSNLAIQRLDVSVYSVTKSTALLFTFALSVFFRLSKPTVPLVLIVLGLAVGASLTSARATGADWAGLAAALTAAMSSAVRWVVTERYYARAGVKTDACTLIAVAAPFTVVSLLPALALELPSVIAAQPLGATSSALAFLCGTLGGGVLAFLLLAAELQLVDMTSALTLTIIGHVKEVVAVLLAVAMFHENLTPVNWTGIALAFSCATWYSVLRSMESKVAIVQGNDGVKPGRAASGKNPEAALQEVAPASHEINLESIDEEEEAEDDDDEAPLVATATHGATVAAGSAAGVQE